MVMLTAQQRQIFHTCGALVLKGALRDEYAELEAAFEAAWSSRERHKTHARQVVGGFLDLDPRLDGFRSHRLINHLQAELIDGEVLRQSGSNGNLHAGDTPWHVDGVGREGARVRINCYLDPVGRGRGCLLVVPGSQRWKILQPIRPEHSQPILPLPHWFGSSPLARHSHIALNSEPGDLVIIDRRVIHAALGGGRRRRMFNLDLEEA